MGHGHGHGHGHGGHGHGHGGRSAGERALWIALILNGAFLILETVAGFWSGSLALLSDAGHMLSDVGALAVAILGIRIAARPASGSYTFGLRRAPVLAALVNALALIAIAAFVAIEAFNRLADPQPMHANTVIGVGVAGLFVNVASAVMLQRSGDTSLNARAAMLHLAADALGSVAAIVAGVLVAWTGWEAADPIASLIIALLIAVATIPLLRQAFNIVLQRAPEFLDELREALTDTPGVERVLDLHCWELDDGEAVVSARLLTSAEDVLGANSIADAARDLLESRFDVSHATLEMRCARAPELACRAVVPR